jgi:hypothetical protein
MPKHKLSDKSIRGLKTPTTGQVDYWDEIMPGFGIRVGHAGTKSFFVGTRINGRYRRITLKPSFPNLSWQRHDRGRGRSLLMRRVA